MENEIKLTLAQEAPQMPTLTLDPEAAEAPQPQPKPQESSVTTLNETMLSPEERRVVEDFSQKIDLKNSTMVMQY